MHIYCIIPAIVGQFGESFPFGSQVGDRVAFIPDDGFEFVFIGTPFTIFGRQNRFLFVSSSFSYENASN